MKTAYTDEQLTRIARLIEEYRSTKRRRLLERAIKRWRRAVMDRRIAELIDSPGRMH